MLVIVSVCEINSYQPVQNEERTDVVRQEAKLSDKDNESNGTY